MICFPNAKINLGLRVLEKRPDGYHSIESCLFPVPWTDILEIIESSTENISFSGLPIPGDGKNNLCWKAYRLLKDDLNIPNIHIHLHKVIPMGGGLGGGSADAAFTLMTLNDLFSLQINEDQLHQYATLIGSDCPLFIKNKTAIATGKGTDLQIFDLDLTGYFIVLIYPGIHIETASAYRKLELSGSKEGEVRKILSLPVDQWKETLINDFEKDVFNNHPEIEGLKTLLYKNGALYASMTGSGATVFGIFKDPPPDLEIPVEYTVWSTAL